MDELFYHLMNVFNRDLLIPIVVPFVLYWIYRYRRVRVSLNDKVVLITGASSGLGEALAHVFHIAGCRVILAARRVGELERVKADLLKLSKTRPDIKTSEPVVFPLDISELETIPSKASEILSIFDRVDIVICNAGISYRGEVIETSLQVQMNVMKINYFGQIALVNALLPALVQSKGHVVAISSVQGRIAIPYRSAYAASKHALQAYMDCLRSEIPHINVTVINPGYINTNLSVNAVTGSGESYGVLDSTTAKGYDPKYVAQRITSAVINREKELTIAPFLPKMAIIFRVLSPSLFFFLLKLWANKKK